MSSSQAFDCQWGWPLRRIGEPTRPCPPRGAGPARTQILWRNTTGFWNVTPPAHLPGGCAAVTQLGGSCLPGRMRTLHKASLATADRGTNANGLQSHRYAREPGYSRIIPHLRARTPFSCQMLAQRLECGQRRRGVLNACGRGRLGRAGHTAGWALLLVPQDQPETPPHEATGAAVPYGAPTSFRHDVGTLALSYRHSLDSKL